MTEDPSITAATLNSASESEKGAPPVQVPPTRPVAALRGKPPVILPGGAEAPSAAHVARASTHAPRGSADAPGAVPSTTIPPTANPSPVRAVALPPTISLSGPGTLGSAPLPGSTPALPSGVNGPLNPAIDPRGPGMPPASVLRVTASTLIAPRMASAVAPPVVRGGTAANPSPAAHLPAGAPLATPLPSAGQGLAGMWPTNVPGVMEAEAMLAMLLNPASSPQWEKVSREVSESLTSIERGLLGQTLVGSAVAVLRPAVLFRWRLAAILATAPEVGTSIDAVALESIILESDTVLSGLKALESMTPEVLGGFVNARNLVARDVVTLADLSVKLKPRDPNAPLSAAEQDAARSRATLQAKVAASTKVLSSRPSLKGLPPLYLLLILCVMGAAGFHGWGWYNATHRVDPSAGLNLPPGAIGSPAANGDLMVMFIPGHDVQPSDVELLRQRADASGKLLREFGHGMFRIESIPAPLPDSPSH